MKYKIEWTYKAKGGQNVLFTSEWLDADNVLITGAELEATKNTRDLTFIDEMNSTWTLKELRKLTAEIAEEPSEIRLYFDGGYNKDTDEAGLGVVIYYKQGRKNYRLRKNECIGEMDTNNEAEYAALLFGLDVLAELGVHHLPVDILGDSQVVLKQLEGEWPCYDENLNRWLDRIEEKIKALHISPRYTYLSRKENKETDKLATLALEGKLINSKIELV